MVNEPRDEARTDEGAAPAEAAPTSDTPPDADSPGPAEGGAAVEPEAGADATQAAAEALDIDTLSELETAHRELNDRHLRLAAEFDNFRRRANSERAEAWTRAQAELVGKLLDTLDDLQRVSDLDPDSATASAILEGVELVERKFLRTLNDAGVEELNPEGEPFDPNVMEAVMRSQTDDPEMDDHVAAVFQRGYTLKGLLVRPARVSVHKAG